MGGECPAGLEERQFDEHGDAGDLRAALGDQLAGGTHGAAGGEQVVDDEDALALNEGVHVDLEAVVAVFEGVVHAVDVAGELAGLAQGYEAAGEGLGDGGAEDEAAALCTDDVVDVLAPEGVCHELDGQGQPGGVGEQGREVFKDDAGLGEVRNFADEGFEVGHRGRGYPLGIGGGGGRATGGTGGSIRPAGLGGIQLGMADRSSKSKASRTLEVIEPIGKRILIRKDEDRKQTKTGIHLPDKIEIPTITGRVVAISTQIDRDDNYPVRQYDRVLFNPKNGIPVDFEGDNRLFVIPVEDVVAVFRRDADE